MLDTALVAMLAIMGVLAFTAVAMTVVMFLVTYTPLLRWLAP